MRCDGILLIVTTIRSVPGIFPCRGWLGCLPDLDRGKRRFDDDSNFVITTDAAMEAVHYFGNTLVVCNLYG